MMTSKLSVTNLVETLNELFGKFDDASEVKIKDNIFFISCKNI